MKKTHTKKHYRFQHSEITHSIKPPVCGAGWGSAGKNMRSVLPRQEGSNASNFPPGGQLVSLKTHNLFGALFRSLSLAGRKFRGDSGQIGLRIYCWV